MNYEQPTFEQVGVSGVWINVIYDLLISTGNSSVVVDDSLFTLYNNTLINCTWVIPLMGSENCPLDVVPYACFMRPGEVVDTWNIVFTFIRPICVWLGQCAVMYLLSRWYMEWHRRPQPVEVVPPVVVVREEPPPQPPEPLPMVVAMGLITLEEFRRREREGFERVDRPMEQQSNPYTARIVNSSDLFEYLSRLEVGAQARVDLGSNRTPNEIVNVALVDSIHNQLWRRYFPMIGDIWARGAVRRFVRGEVQASEVVSNWITYSDVLEYEVADDCFVATFPYYFGSSVKVSVWIEPAIEASARNSVATWNAHVLGQVEDFTQLRTFEYSGYMGNALQMLRIAAEDVPIFEERLHGGDRSFVIEVVQGVLTREYVIKLDAMQPQAKPELMEIELKRDQGKRRKEAYVKDKGRKVQAMQRRIATMQKNLANMEKGLAAKQEARRARKDMEEQAIPGAEMMGHLSAELKRILGKFECNSKFLKVFMNPKIVGNILYSTVALDLFMKQTTVMAQIEAAFLALHHFVPKGGYEKVAAEIVYLISENYSIPGLTARNMQSIAANFANIHNPSAIDDFIMSQQSNTLETMLVSDTWAHLKKCVSVMVAIGLVPATGLKLHPEGLRLFTFEATQKAGSIEDVLHTVVSTAEYFITRGREYFVTYNVEDLLFEDRNKSVVGLMARLGDKRELMNGEEINLIEFRTEIEEGIKFLELKSKRATEMMRAYYIRYIITLQSYKTTVEGRLRGFRPVRAPTAFNVWGTSGVGKSTVAGFLSQAVAKANGEESYIGCTAFHSSATKFDDTMNPNAKQVIEDDANYIQQQFAQQPQGSMVMDLVNNLPKPTNQAELSLKGVVRKTADNYIATSNSERMYVKSFNCDDALFRRLIAVQVELKEEACDRSQGNMLDSGFAVRELAEGRIPDTVWKLTMRKWDLSTSTYKVLYYRPANDSISLKEPLDTDTDAVKLEHINLTMMLRMVRIMVTEHNKVQKHVVKFLNNPIPSCPHSNFKQLCEEVNEEGVRCMDQQSLSVVADKMVECGSAVIDVLRWRCMGILNYIPIAMKIRLVCSTSWLWAPILGSVARWYGGQTAAQYKRTMVMCMGTLVSMLVIIMLFICLLYPDACEDGWTMYGIYALASLQLGILYQLVALMASFEAASASILGKLTPRELKMSVEGLLKACVKTRERIILGILGLVGAALLARKILAKPMKEQSIQDRFTGEPRWNPEAIVLDRPVAEVKESTEEQLERKLSEHIACVLAVNTGTTSFVRSRAIPYKNGIWIMNLHFVKEIEGCPVEMENGCFKRQLTLTRDDWVEVEGDVALVRVLWPAMPDFSKWIATTKSEIGFPAKWMLREHDGSVVSQRLRLEPNHKEEKGLSHKLMTYRGNLGLPSQLGMCGAAVVAVGPKPCIIGMHGGGYTGYGVIAVIPLVADALEESYMQLIGKKLESQGMFSKFLGKKVNFDKNNIPAKCPVNFLDEERRKRVHVLGAVEFGTSTDKLHGHTKKSPLHEGMVEEFGESVHGPSLHHQPSWTSHQPAIFHACTDHVFDSEARTYAMAAVRDIYMSAFKSGAYDGVEPYTAEQVIKGVDNKPFVNGINWNSGVGLPRTGSKKEYAFLDKDGKRMLDKEILDEQENLYDALGENDHEEFMFGEFKCKDEATKVKVNPDTGKKETKLARVYVAFPVSFQIVCSRVFGPLNEVKNYHPEKFQACVGLNMLDGDASFVAWKAGQFGEEHTLDGDVAHYDQSCTPEETVDLAQIDIEIMELSPGYSDKDVRRAKEITKQLAIPKVLVNQVAMSVNGMTESGQSKTIHDNDKRTKFLIAYSFYKKWIKLGLPIVGPSLDVEYMGTVRKIPNLFKVASLMTVGDDHIGSIIPVYRPIFSMTSVSEELGDVDIVYTDTQKNLKVKEFDALYSTLSGDFNNVYSFIGAEFVKRRFVKVLLQVRDCDYDIVVMPLEVNSILKSLYWKGSFESPVPWTNAVVQGAMREVFYYGEAVYDDFKVRMKRMLRSIEMEDYVDPIKSFEEHMVKYVNNLPKSMTQKFEWDGMLEFNWEGEVTIDEIKCSLFDTKSSRHTG